MTAIAGRPDDATPPSTRGASAAPARPQTSLGVGDRVTRHGEVWTIKEFLAGGGVRLACGGRTWTADFTEVVGLWFDDFLGRSAELATTHEEAEEQTRRELAAGPKGKWLRPEEPGAAGLVLDLISRQEHDRLTDYAAHIQEVLTGHRHGSAALALPDEPRPEYDGTSRRARLFAKAAELRTSEARLRRHTNLYEAHGLAGLVRAELLHQSSCLVACDPRFLAAVQRELDEHVNASTVSQQVLYARALLRVKNSHGQEGVERCPKKTQGYAILNTLGKPRGFFGGVSAKTRRSIANSPVGTYGALRATRPGEYVLLDTTTLDVFAMDRATGMWVRLELTVAIDLFSRSIVAMRLTPYTTKAKDVAGLLYDCSRPKWFRERWHDRAKWRYPGLPAHLVVDTDELADADGRPLAGIPLVAPETLVIDHGKVYVSELVRSVCRRLGISIQPARPYTPTDKAVVERWFLTLRTGLLQNLKGYKGPDVFSRGKDAEGEAFYFIDELEEILWQWVATVHQTRKHKGLVLPEAPHQCLTPNEMYDLGVERAGFVGVPYHPDLAFEFLPITWREIAGDGITIRNFRYNGPGLDDYRDMPGPRPVEHRDRWPFWTDPDDIRQVWFRVPDGPRKGEFVPVPWEHRDQVPGPFGDDVGLEAKRRVVAGNRPTEDLPLVIAEMLAGWEEGTVNGRREHRVALRNAKTRVETEKARGRRVTPRAFTAVFPADAPDVPQSGQTARRAPLAAVPPLVEPVGDDDEDIEIADLDPAQEPDGYYDDALGDL